MSNDQQIEYWNTEAGKTWVLQAEALDLLMHSIGTAVIARAALQPGSRVLDIGCGSGALTFAAQDRVGDTGCATGLDVSLPLVRNAQQRASERQSKATFVVGDAAAWRSDTEADTVISRFGVMFFDDPVAAFANILQLTKPGGTLNFSCWRSPKDNDMAHGLMLATSHLFTPPTVKPDPRAPGPYAFADQDYVSSILANAGWRDVAFEIWQGRLPLPSKSARENAQFLASMGPIGRAMREQNIAVERVIDALLPFLEKNKENDRYSLSASAWLVSARR